MHSPVVGQLTVLWKTRASSSLEHAKYPSPPWGGFQDLPAHVARTQPLWAALCLGGNNHR